MVKILPIKLCKMNTEIVYYHKSGETIFYRLKDNISEFDGASKPCIRDFGRWERTYKFKYNQGFVANVVSFLTIHSFLCLWDLRPLA